MMLPNPRKKIPKINIFMILHSSKGMDINIWPTYLNFVCPTIFLEKVGLKNTLPTYNLDICPKFQNFSWKALLTCTIRVGLSCLSCLSCLSYPHHLTKVKASYLLVIVEIYKFANWKMHWIKSLVIGCILYIMLDECLHFHDNYLHSWSL